MKLRAIALPLLLSAATWFGFSGLGRAATWERPPQAIRDVLDAPELPSARPSPDGATLAMMKGLRYPPIADLARPALKLAGVRIDPATNGRYANYYFVELRLLRVADGSENAVALPPNPRVFGFVWSADGRRFAFLHEASDRVELWVGETATASAKRIEGLQVNPSLWSEVTWMPDQKRLLVKAVPSDRGAPPPAPLVPEGPRVRESAGGTATSTYEARDLLASAHDEALFEHYATSQLALVDAASGRIARIGAPGILAGVDPSPDGSRILVQRVLRPFSYSVAWYRFPRDVEVLDLDGRVVHTAARLPLADQVPIRGVPEGPREHGWRPTEPATLVWTEALDGGDPGRKAENRDRMMMQRSPFREAPREVYRAPHRLVASWWGEQDGLLLVQEWERERRWRHVWVLHADEPSVAPRKLVDLSENDQYADPGYPLLHETPDGRSVLAQKGDSIFFTGSGATPEGDRPFLDRLSLTSFRTERLFRCDADVYEYFVDWLDLDGGTFLTRRESPAEPPNYFARTLAARRPETGGAAGEAAWDADRRPLTRFADPTPQIRGITKRIVTYERADGTPLSFTLYLPSGYVEGTRLPTVFDAYPLEFSDPATAGQVSGTERGFTRLLGTTALFYLLDGYAVLDNVAMPVIGDPDTAYDTFIEQLTADAEAAIARAGELGVTDPKRVGVIGHSHGALMVATLLAHTDLFRAGIARSGAYNHTMRPFGFQGERRTLWQAPETYVRISPLRYADKINEPLLLIHGEADPNPGTVPLQSEKLFEAVRGTGGTVRLVMLPFEQHGYQSREAVEQVLADQLRWFGMYVKGGE